MTLSAARSPFPPFKPGSLRYRRYRMAASTTIYEGGLVMINSSGLAVPAAAAASNKGCVGIADKTTTSDGSTATYVRVRVGTCKLPGTSLTQAMVGGLVYGQADDTIGATGTNLPIAGVLEEYISATSGWMSIGSEFLT